MLLWIVALLDCSRCSRLEHAFQKCQHAINALHNADRFWGIFCKSSTIAVMRISTSRRLTSTRTLYIAMRIAFGQPVECNRGSPQRDWYASNCHPDTFFYRSALFRTIKRSSEKNETLISLFLWHQPSFRLLLIIIIYQTVFPIKHWTYVHSDFFVDTPYINCWQEDAVSLKRCTTTQQGERDGAHNGSGDESKFRQEAFLQKIGAHSGSDDASFIEQAKVDE